MHRRRCRLHRCRLYEVRFAVVAVVTATVVVVDSTVAALLDAAGPTVAGPDAPQVVPATTGRNVVLGLEVLATGGRRVVLAHCAARYRRLQR